MQGDSSRVSLNIFGFKFIDTFGWFFMVIIGILVSNNMEKSYALDISDNSPFVYSIVGLFIDVVL